MSAKKIFMLILALMALCFVSGAASAALPATAPSEMNPAFIYISRDISPAWSRAA
jgi:hypothetical protein